MSETDPSTKSHSEPRRARVGSVSLPPLLITIALANVRARRAAVVVYATPMRSAAVDPLRQLAGQPTWHADRGYNGGRRRGDSDSDLRGGGGGCHRQDAKARAGRAVRRRVGAGGRVGGYDARSDGSLAPLEGRRHRNRYRNSPCSRSAGLVSILGFIARYYLGWVGAESIR